MTGPSETDYSEDGKRLAEAALALVGTPFRLGGRDVRRGLDCVGLVWASLASIGRNIDAPTGYGLRNRNVSSHFEAVESAGLGPFEGPRRAGDVILARPGPGQHHLAITYDRNSFIHAHIALGKVVHAFGHFPWSVAMQWRLTKFSR